MEWITPKTNWSNSDNLNAADLNRIGNNINYIAAQLTAVGISNNVTFESSFSMEIIPFSYEVQHLFNLIFGFEYSGYQRHGLYDFFKPYGFITTPWSNRYLRDTLNAAEHNLLCYYNSITMMNDKYKHCGRAVCGRRL